MVLLEDDIPMVLLEHDTDGSDMRIRFVMNITQVACSSLYNSSNRPRLHGRKSEGRTPLSRPIKDLGSSQPLLRSEDPPKLSPLAKTASDEKLGKMSTIDHPPGDDAVVHLDEQPRFSQPRFPDEMDRLGSDEIIQNNEKMIYDRKASADTDLMSIPIAPLALSGDQRLSLILWLVCDEDVIPGERRRLVRYGQGWICCTGYIHT
eukprot:1389292-Amorphochlora_amoeboformis.AAC.2